MCHCKRTFKERRRKRKESNFQRLEFLRTLCNRNAPLLNCNLQVMKTVMVGCERNENHSVLYSEWLTKTEQDHQVSYFLTRLSVMSWIDALSMAVSDQPRICDTSGSICREWLSQSVIKPYPSLLDLYLTNQIPISCRTACHVRSTTLDAHNGPPFPSRWKSLMPWMAANQPVWPPDNCISLPNLLLPAALKWIQRLVLRSTRQTSEYLSSETCVPSSFQNRCGNEAGCSKNLVIHMWLLTS